MSAPFFYINNYDSSAEIELDEDTSRHVVQVLRMSKDERINLTDGKGSLLVTSIIDDHRKRCRVKVLEKNSITAPALQCIIGISLLKNPSRFEWFLEKATELGITSIVPLLCSRTEKEKFRQDRLQQVLISAMLQSQQCWLPVLHSPIDYNLLFRQEDIIGVNDKYIAHCLDTGRQALSDVLKQASHSRIILIGPEGDFTEEEIALALASGFKAVTLGETRLRAETAGMVAATLLRLV